VVPSTILVSPGLTNFDYPDTVTKEDRSITSLIAPTFDPELPLLTTEEQVITSIVIEVAPSIRDLPELTTLIGDISKLCRAVGLHARRRIHIFLQTHFLQLASPQSRDPAFLHRRVGYSDP
jgi:hypothetical protein